MPESDAAIDVALCQYELRGVGSVAALVDRISELVDRAGPADLYVLPELLTTDLVDTPDASVEDTALSPDGVERYHACLERVAGERDAVVVGGSYNISVDRAVLNRCPIAVPDGELTTYDKRHPTPNERGDGKVGGVDEPPVVDHRGVGIGVVICYDVEFPETVRQVVNRGAEVLAVPSWTATEAGVQRVRRCSAARAIENQLYVAYVPLVGDHLGDRWAATGRGAVFAPADGVVGPYATRLSLPRDEHTAGRCRLDVAALRESRRSAEVRPYADYRDPDAES